MQLKTCIFTDTLSGASCIIDQVHGYSPEAHEGTGKNGKEESYTFSTLIMNTVRQAQRERQRATLRHCFLQDKCSIITTSAAKTDSHKCKMNQNRASWLQTSKHSLLISCQHLLVTDHVSLHSILCGFYCR